VRIDPRASLDQAEAGCGEVEPPDEIENPLGLGEEKVVGRNRQQESGCHDAINCTRYNARPIASDQPAEHPSLHLVCAALAVEDMSRLSAALALAPLWFSAAA